MGLSQYFDPQFNGLTNTSIILQVQNISSNASHEATCELHLVTAARASQLEDIQTRKSAIRVIGASEYICVFSSKMPDEGLMLRVSDLTHRS